MRFESHMKNISERSPVQIRLWQLIKTKAIWKHRLLYGLMAVGFLPTFALTA